MVKNLIFFCTFITSIFQLGRTELCSKCSSVEVTSTSDAVHRKHNSLLGTYRKLPNLVNGMPAYEHYSGYFYLYYNSDSQGFWAVGETLGSDVVRLENQGDRVCPYFLKSLWRYADGELNALVYDLTLSVVCLTEPCSVANCGFQASCVKEARNRTTTVCQCNRGYIGNPYERCYPSRVSGHCNCRRLLFTTDNPKALDKQESTYGEYFLYGEYQGNPVYQHFAGVEYLYNRDGNWLISDKIGLREAGMQNQGEENPAFKGKPVCPYRFRTSWEYADIDQPGWQWVYDHRAKLVCPSDPCSVTRCGFNAKCHPGRKTTTQCKCFPGYEGDPYDRCFPKFNSTAMNHDCACKRLQLSSNGTSALAQSDKMGMYFFQGEFNGRTSYQHESGLDYLYYSEGNAWVIGANFGGSRVGIVNFDNGICPYKDIQEIWRHSSGGKLKEDAHMILKCLDRNFMDVLAQRMVEQNPNDNKEVTKNKKEDHITTTPITLIVASTLQDEKMSSIYSTNKVTFTTLTTTVATTTTTTTLATFPSTTTITSASTTQYFEPDIQDANIPSPLVQQQSYPCNCPEIVINSTNPNTINKHGYQLGVYSLYQNGLRPIYRLILGRPGSHTQYLYYQESGGGNWLINSEIGLLYGGIQNSKDTPICPYSLNTMWQFGDSELGGWEYDPTLTVTCPTDQCSILRCGFRADCVEGIFGHHCQCQNGFEGNPYERCFPILVHEESTCSCRRVRLSSTGPAAQHQRDKMGNYYLWGYYNDGYPVYQHESGLDFVYFHTSSVWGVGPKVGGNSAGLLNFGSGERCPYHLSTPWEYGTRKKTNRRLIDITLKVECTIPPPIAHPQISQPQVESTPSVAAPFERLLNSPVPHQIQLTTTPPSVSNRRIYESSTCGVRNADSNSIPWQVQIATATGNIMKHVCSGVIISSLHILTAASCLVDYPLKSFRIIVGQNNLIEPEEGEKRFGIRNAYLHDDFYSEEGKSQDESGNLPFNDIAVIKLREEIPFDDEITPICLSPENNKKQSQCEYSGWNLGSTRTDLLKTSTKIQGCSDTHCHILNNNEESKDCALDYGGTPLVCQEEGDLNFIVGMGGGKHQSCQQFGFNFQRIDSYHEWIISRIAL